MDTEKKKSSKKYDIKDIEEIFNHGEGSLIV